MLALRYVTYFRFYYSAPDRGAEYCDERVCVCACLSVHKHIYATTRPIFTTFLMRVTYGRGSVLLWRRSDMSCTSCFMDDVMFAHKPRLLDVAAQLKRGAHAALGLAINHAQKCQLQANGRTGLLYFRRLKIFPRWQPWLPCWRDGLVVGVQVSLQSVARFTITIVRQMAPPVPRGRAGFKGQLPRGLHN